MSDRSFTRTTAGPCPSELTLSIYVDRELDPEATRSVDAHLVACPACRETVVALGDEGAAIRGALSLEPQPQVATSPVALRPSLGLGVGATLAASVAALSVLGWLLEMRAPSTVEWLNPFSLGGLFSMFFDAVSILRDQGPAVYQLTVAATALLSVSFLLTTTLTLVTRRLFERTGAMLIFGLAALAAGTSTPAEAIELAFGGETFVLPAGEVIEDTVVTNADSVVIEGTLRGDLVSVGDRLVVTGVVEGNVFAGARRIEIEGLITGTLVALGERIRVAGRVDGNVFTAADQTHLAETAQVGRSLASFGEGLEVSGVVGRDLLAHLEWLELRGTIGDGAIVRVEQADVLHTARVGGDLDLRYRREADTVVVDDGAHIGGELSIERAHVVHDDRFARYASHEFYTFSVLSLAAAFLTGMLVFRAAPWVFGSTFRNGPELLWPTLHGIAAVFATPFAIVILALTVVGIPLALAGLAVWGAVLYLAKIVVGAAIGLAIIGPPPSGSWRGFAAPLITGLVVVHVATALPFVGGVVGFFVLLLGSGAVAMRVRERIAS